MPLLLLPIIYLAFVGLGLPDGLLGAAWPQMHASLQAPLSYQGAVSALIMAGTIVSSLLTNRLVARFGTGRLTLGSVALTMVALVGFAASPSLPVTCLIALPYGLGAGAVDAALNAYVATHYAARHMNWLHMCWGIGAAGGPLALGAIMAAGHSWRMGYVTIGLVQCALVAVLAAALPLWKQAASARDAAAHDDGTRPDADGAPPRAADDHAHPTSRGPAAHPHARGRDSQAHTRKAVAHSRLIRLPGAPQALGAFLCYCALESSCGLWAATFLTGACRLDAATAASLAALFYGGIAAGRGVAGLLTRKMTAGGLMRLGIVLIALGLAALAAAAFLPAYAATLAGSGLLLVGLGCAPVYPQMIHLTPVHFGAEHNQSMMGLQMASAYTGSLVVPPLLGIALGTGGTALLPAFLCGLLVALALCLHALDRQRSAQRCGQR